MTAQDKSSTYDQTVAIKQTGLRRLIDRRIEWFFAQALNGKIDYTSDEGRSFSFDYDLHVMFYVPVCEFNIKPLFENLFLSVIIQKKYFIPVYVLVH